MADRVCSVSKVVMGQSHEVRLVVYLLLASVPLSEHFR